MAKASRNADSGVEFAYVGNPMIASVQSVGLELIVRKQGTSKWLCTWSWTCLQLNVYDRALKARDKVGAKLEALEAARELACSVHLSLEDIDSEDWVAAL